MRDLTIVIDQIINVLEKDIQSNHESIIKILLDRKDSCCYTAPEAVHDRWREVYGILINQNLLGIENETQLEITHIFTTTSKEELLAGSTK